MHNVGHDIPVSVLGAAAIALVFWGVGLELFFLFLDSVHFLSFIMLWRFKTLLEN